jgi:nucleoside-diphosphate-sugar epimerase
VTEVPDYGHIDARSLTGCDAVIDFVGVSEARDPALFHAVNVELAARLARAARAAGLRQFVYLSSLAVYPNTASIHAGTPVAPASEYGKSKAEAEAVLAKLATEDFAVTILRIPTVYGTEGNSKISRLARFLRKLPAFPAPRQLPRRSVISHDNLSRVVLSLLVERRGGTVHAADPQPFTLDLLTEASSGTRLLTVPKWLLAPLRAILPSIYESVYCSMEIAPELLYEPSVEALVPTAAALDVALGLGANS